MKRTPLKRKTPLKAKAPASRTKSRTKTSKIRQSAKGQQCTVGIPQICNGNPETVVLAHLNGGGMGAKHPDIHAAFSCSACHSWLDGGYANTGYNRDIRDLWHLQAVIRTQLILIKQGLMEVAA